MKGLTEVGRGSRQAGNLFAFKQILFMLPLLVCACHGAEVGWRELRPGISESSESGRVAYVARIGANVFALNHAESVNTDPAYEQAGLPARSISATQVVASGTLIGTNEGEHGGGLYYLSRTPGTSAPERLIDDNVVQILPENAGRRFVLCGLSHLATCRGSVWEIKDFAGGKPVAERVTLLVGTPIAGAWRGGDLCVLNGSGVILLRGLTRDSARMDMRMVPTGLSWKTFIQNSIAVSDCGIIIIGTDTGLLSFRFVPADFSKEDAIGRVSYMPLPDLGDTPINVILPDMKTKDTRKSECPPASHIK